MTSGNLRSGIGLALAAFCVAAQANYSSFSENFQPTGASDDVLTTAPILTGVSFPNFYSPSSRYWHGDVPPPGGDASAPIWGHVNGSEKLTDEAGNQFIRLTSDSSYGFDGVYVTLSLNAGYYSFGFDYRAPAASSLAFSITRTSPNPPWLFSATLGNESNWTSFSTSPSSLDHVFLGAGTYKLAWEDALKDDGKYVDIDNISVKSITAVPEPETYAMLLMGLGVVSFVGMRKRDLA